MKQLNTIPIENFLEKARIAQKSGTRVVNLSLEEATQLSDSLAVVMTRLSGELDKLMSQAVNQPQQDLSVNMDGGTF